MAFDPTTAVPVDDGRDAGGTFDPSTATPVEKESEKRFDPSTAVEIEAPGLLDRIGAGASRLGTSYKTGISTLLGDEAARKAAEAGTKEQERISRELGPVAGWEEVKQAYEKDGVLAGAGEFVSQVPGAVAEQLPQMAGFAGSMGAGALVGSVIPGIGTLAGSIAGAALYLYPQLLGANLEEQAAQDRAAGRPVDLEYGKAAAAAAGQTALEAAGGIATLGANTVRRIVGKEVSKAVAEKKLVEAAQRSLSGTVAGGAARGLTEMPVEVGQQILTRWQAGQDLLSDEAIADYGQAAYGALQAGPAMGALASPLDRRSAVKELESRGLTPTGEKIPTAATSAEQRSQLEQEQQSADYMRELDKQALEERQKAMGVSPTPEGQYRLNLPKGKGAVPTTSVQGTPLPAKQKGFDVYGRPLAPEAETQAPAGFTYAPTDMSTQLDQTMSLVDLDAEETQLRDRLTQLTRTKENRPEAEAIRGRLDQIKELKSEIDELKLTQPKAEKPKAEAIPDTALRTNELVRAGLHKQAGYTKQLAGLDLADPNQRTRAAEIIGKALENPKVRPEAKTALQELYNQKVSAPVAETQQAFDFGVEETQAAPATEISQATFNELGVGRNAALRGNQDLLGLDFTNPENAPFIRNALETYRDVRGRSPEIVDRINAFLDKLPEPPPVMDETGQFGLFREGELPVPPTTPETVVKQPEVTEPAPEVKGVQGEMFGPRGGVRKEAIPRKGAKDATEPTGTPPSEPTTERPAGEPSVGMADVGDRPTTTQEDTTGGVPETGTEGLAGATGGVESGVERGEKAPVTVKTAPKKEAPKKEGPTTRKKDAQYNLRPVEDLFQDLDSKREVDYKDRSKLIRMSIDDFLALAKKLQKPDNTKKSHIQNLIKSGKKFESIPFLQYNIEGDRAIVIGHEGRHRAIVLKEMGYNEIPVILRGDIRWSEQSSPENFDYQQTWPKVLIGEKPESNARAFPVSREDSSQPYTDAPQSFNENKKEAPKKEAPKKEAPKKEAPKKEAPKKEAPKKKIVINLDGFTDTGKAGLRDIEDVHTGELVYANNGIALVRGFHANFVKFRYMPVKGERYSTQDVRSFTNKSGTFTDEELKDLRAAVEQLEQEATAKHESNPFITFEDGVAFSENMSKEMRGIAKELRDLLGIKTSIYFTTKADALADKNKFTGPHRAAAGASRDKDANGVTAKMEDGSYFVAFIPSTDKSFMLETLGHELGHVQMFEHFDEAPESTKNAIKNEFDAWLAKNKGGLAKDYIEALRARQTIRRNKLKPTTLATQLRGFNEYWASFDEWYADQVSRWAVSSEKPQTVVEKFFKRLADALRKFYSSLQAKKYLPNETFKQYLDSLSPNISSMIAPDDPFAKIAEQLGDATKVKEKGNLRGEQPKFKLPEEKKFEGWGKPGEGSDVANAAQALHSVGDSAGGVNSALQEALVNEDPKTSLQAIKDNADNVFTDKEVLVARKLLDLSGPLPTMRIVDSLGVDKNGDPILGQYDSVTDEISLVRGAADSHTFLHEMIHAFVHRTIIDQQQNGARNPKFKQLEDVYNYVLEKRPDLAKEYGMQSLTEFASEAMSNRDFQMQLMGIEYKKESVFGWFARTLRELMGLDDTGTVGNTLFTAMVAVDGLMRTGRDLQLATKGKLIEDAITNVVAQTQQNINTPLGKPLPTTLAEVNKAPDQVLRTEGAKFAHMYADNETGFATIFRQKAVDVLAPIAKKLNTAFSEGVRDAFGDVNPLVWMRQAFDHQRIALQVFREGGLQLRKDGTWEAFNLKDKDGKPVSAQKAIELIRDFAKKENTSYKTMKGRISTVLEGMRLKDLREHNAKIETLAREQAASGDIDAAYETRKTKFALHMTNAEIDSLVEIFNKTPEIQEIQRVMNAVRGNLVDAMVESGRITDKQADAWKAAVNYIPFDRLKEIGADPEAMFGTKHKGLAVLAQLPKLRGSFDRPVANAIDNFMGTMAWMTEQSMRNSAVVRTLNFMVQADMARKLPNKKAAQKTHLVLPNVYENGKPVFYEVQNEYDFAAFAQAPEITSTLVKGLSKASRVLRTTVTATPMFAIKQVFDDAQRAMFYSGVKSPLAAAGRTMINLPRILIAKAFGKNTEAIKLLERLGIVGDYDFNPINPAETLEMDTKAVKRGVVRSLIHAMEQVTKASDMAARLAVYEQTMKETGDSTLAQSRARELINFNRQGSSKSMQVLSHIVPFFTSWAQGTDLLYRGFSGIDNPAGINRKAAYMMFGTRIATMMAFATLYALAMSDDEGYEGTSDEVRDRSWILPKSFSDALGMEQSLKIPVPPELGFIFKSIPERAYQYYKDYTKGENKSAMDAVVNVAKDAIKVYGVAPVPAALRPIGENIANFSLFTYRPLVSPGMETRPNALQYNASTSEFAKWLGERADVSPIKVDNFMRGYFGLMWSSASMMLDGMMNPGRPARNLNQLPFLSIGLMAPVGTRTKDDFYEFREKVAQAVAGKNALKDDPEKMATFVERNSALIAAAPYVNEKAKALRKLREQKKILQGSAIDMSSKERREILTDIERTENALLSDIAKLRNELGE